MVWFGFCDQVDCNLIDQDRETCSNFLGAESLAPAAVWIQGCLKCFYILVGQAAT